MAAFLNCHLRVLFQKSCQSAKLLSASAENCSQSVSFGTRITSNMNFAAFHLLIILCKRLLSAVQVQPFLVWCYGKRFPSGCPWSHRLFFVGDDSSPLYPSFPSLSDPSLRLTIFLRNSDGTAVAAQDTPVRRLIEFQRTLRCVQINHKQSVMMVLHVDVGLLLRVGAWIQQ